MIKRIALIAGVLIAAYMSLWRHFPDREAAESIFLPMEYMVAASALYEEDFAEAKTSLQGLAASSTGNLRSKALVAADTLDIEAMREAFKTLTEEVAINMSYPDEYAVAFCATYKDGSKWIQKREAPIANPYLGKSMPACGSFVD
jgi:hypothetical protein